MADIFNPSLMHKFKLNVYTIYTILIQSCSSVRLCDYIPLMANLDKLQLVVIICVGCRLGLIRARSESEDVTRPVTLL